MNYKKSALRISRTCDAGPHLLSNPKAFSCKRLMMNNVISLVNNKNLEQLQELYQAPHWIPWFDLNYGGNPEGIFTAACPPEALHALENGIYQYVIHELYKHLLKPASSVLLDKHIKSWHEYPRQRYLQSFDIEGYPRLMFTSGISKLTNLKADDKAGIIFCIVISAIQANGHNIFLNNKQIGEGLHQNITTVFELMLCYRAWLKRKTYWKRNDVTTFYNVQKAIEKMLDLIIKMVPRTDRQSWELAKIHEQLHVAENIQLYGAHENVHTGPQEHNHIENTKKPSKQVQRRKTILDWQLVNRMSEMYIINAASQTFQIANESIEHVSSVSQPGIFEVCPNSGRFSILLTKQGINKKIVVYFKWLSKKQKTMQISNEILSAIICHYGDAIYGNEILGFTEMEKEKTLYRADIDYRGLGCWYDNIMVDWEATNYLITAELRMFFQMENSNQSFALIHSCHDRWIYHSVLS